MYSDAVLYKVVGSIEKQLRKVSKVSLSEQERYLEAFKRKQINQ